MNELISKIDVTAIQNAIQKGIEYGGEFFLRFQHYAITLSIFFIVLSLIILWISLYYLKPARAWAKEKESDESSERPYIFFLHAFGILFGGFMLISWSRNLIEAIYVPEIYLLQMIN